MKIFIDPGHGGKDSGAVGNSLLEKDLVLDISLRQKRIFEALGHEIQLSRSTDVFIELIQRTKLANDWNADVFISNHINAGGGKGEEVWCSIVGGKGREYAERVEKELSKLFISRGVKTRQGKNGDYLYVIRTTKMPAILNEFGFIDNKEDAANLSKEDFREECAKAVVEGILNIDLEEVSQNNKIVEESKNIEIKTEVKQEVKLQSTVKVDSEVKQVQHNLNRIINANLIEDGIMGPKTRAAVITFQKIVNLVPDGISGVKTKAALEEILRFPLCSVNHRDDKHAIAYLQWRFGIKSDGVFGTQTRQAVINYQKTKGLVVDGIVGQVTWKELFK